MRLEHLDNGGDGRSRCANIVNDQDGAYVVQWRNERFERWWGRVRQRYAGESLHEHIRVNPKAKSAVLESVRSLERSVCDEVIPILGDVAADYLSGKEDADWFFRGLTRMLADLTSDELAELCRLTRGVTAATEHREPGEDADVFEKSDEPGVLLHARPGDSYPDFLHVGADFRFIQRLFYLLKHHGLGQDIKGGTFGGQPGPTRILVPIQVLRRLATFVCPVA